MASAQYTVQVLVKQVRSLSGSSNSPYATIKIVTAKGKRVGEKKKTDTHKDGGSAAIWNSEISFEGKDGIPEKNIGNYKVFVGIRSKGRFSNTKLGDVSIDLDDFKGKEKAARLKWYDIFDDQGLVAGEVEVAVRVFDPSKVRRSTARKRESSEGNKVVGGKEDDVSDEDGDDGTGTLKDQIERLSIVKYEDEIAVKSKRKPEELEGYLFKRGRGIKANWKQRYFKIVKARDGGSYKLEYYEHKAQSKNSSSAKGFVQVNPNSEILRCDVDGKENGFKLTSTTGAKYSRTNDFFLQATGEFEMLTWIDALKKLKREIEDSVHWKEKIAITSAASKYLSMPTVLSGNLFRTAPAPGNTWVILHAIRSSNRADPSSSKSCDGEDEASDEKSVAATATVSPPPAQGGALVVYTKKGDKFCENCVPLAGAVVGAAPGMESFYVRMRSGAQYDFDAVEEDHSARQAVVKEWINKLRLAGCKQAVTTQRRSPNQRAMLHAVRKRLSSGGEKRKQKKEEERKKKEKLSQEEKIKKHVEEILRNARKVPRKLESLTHGTKESDIFSVSLRDYHPPSISAAGSPSSSPKRRGSLHKKHDEVRRRHSWGSHAGFMRFRKLMRRRLHMCIEAYASPTTAAVREVVTENGIASKVPKIAALVVDKRSRSALPHLMSLNKVATLAGCDAGIVDIENERESLPCAVYILGGHRDSVLRLAKDFALGTSTKTAEERAMYKSRIVVLFMERPDLSDEKIRSALSRLFVKNQIFRGCLASVPRIIQCVALPINECGAYCGCQKEVEMLMSKRRYGEEDEDEGNSGHRLVERVVSLLTGMNEWPIFRHDAASPLARTFANTINKRMKAYMGRETDWWYRGPFTGEPDPTMLVVDRSFDIVAPLMRNNSLQGAMFDHLKAEELSPITKGFAVDRVFNMFRWLSPKAVIKDADANISTFEGGGRVFKDESECAGARKYRSIAKKVLEASGGKSMFDVQVELHQEIASGFVAARGGGGGGGSAAAAMPPPTPSSAAFPYEELRDVRKMHARVIETLGTNYSIVEEDDYDEEDDGDGGDSSKVSKCSSLAKKRALTSLARQTEALFIFSYFWREFLRTGKIPKDEVAHKMSEQLCAEVSSVGFDTKGLEAEFRLFPKLARQYLRLLEDGFFAPKTYHVRGGKTQSVETIAAELRNVDADELFELNAHKFPKRVFFKKFTKHTAIKNPVDLTLPSHFAMDLKIRKRNMEARYAAEKSLSHVSRITQAFEELINGTLSDVDFPSVNRRMAIPGQTMKPRTIILVLGGISWFEFLQLTETARKLKQSVTVISTRFFSSASDFLGAAKRLASLDDDGR
eukprot:g1330.t1